MIKFILLELFVKREQLDELNTWYCSTCKNHRRAFKKIDIYRLPPVLILNLKRFTFEQSTCVSAYDSLAFVHREKINTVVQFPVTALDLGSFVNGKKGIHDVCEGEDKNECEVGKEKHAKSSIYTCVCQD